MFQAACKTIFIDFRTSRFFFSFVENWFSVIFPQFQLPNFLSLSLSCLLGFIFVSTIDFCVRYFSCIHFQGGSGDSPRDLSIIKISEKYLKALLFPHRLEM